MPDPSRPIDDIVRMLNQIQAINNFDIFLRAKPGLVQAVTDLKTYLTNQESQINNLTATINQDQVTIGNLTTQNNSLQQDAVAKQKIIDDLTARLAAATAAPIAKPLDLANAFKSVVDQIQQQARQQAADAATTITNAQVEIKALVGLQGADTVMVLPTPAAPLDPNQLSTFRVSFGAIPLAPRPAAPPGPAAAPRPAAGPARGPERAATAPKTIEEDPRVVEYREKRSDDGGRARPDLWLKGLQQFMTLKQAAARARRRSAARFAATDQWIQIGPAPLRIDTAPPRDPTDASFQGQGPDSGEVTDIAIDPSGSEDETIYIATNDGGIWKSADGGANWDAKTDGMPSLSMGAVALDPGDPSTVYAGTGNLFDGGAQFTKGVGVYKSTDGGDHWTVQGGSVFTNFGPNQANLGINRIVLPAPGVLLVATNAGLFRSVDGAQNFGANDPAYDDGNPILNGFVTGLILDSGAAPDADHVTVYACIKGNGILKSSDSGRTFPENLFANPGAPAAFDNVVLTQSVLPDNQTMYASVQQGSTYVGLFKSTDGGQSWMSMPDAKNRANEDGSQVDQTSYDLTVAVDPQDPNRVFIGFQQLHRSTNGGNTFPNPPCSNPFVHWDHHAIVFSPRSHWGDAGPPTTFYVGTDGGIAKNTDGGGPSWTNLNEGVASNLFVGIDIGRGSTANNAYTFGGMQDTGVAGHRPGDAGNDWHQAIDGDGGPVAVDPANPQIVYGNDNSNLIKSTDGGTTWLRSWANEIGAGLPASVSRLTVDPGNSQRIYAAAQGGSGPALFQSTDGGASFAQTQTFAAPITSIAVDPNNSDRLWVALSDGSVHLTTNATSGATAWDAVPFNASTGVTGRAAESIAVDPNDSNRAVVVYSGFVSGGGSTPRVFLSANGGQDWTDISGNIPDLPLHAVAIDPKTSPSTIIVGSDAGVLFTTDDGANWQVLGTGLPTVDCLSLCLDSSVDPPLLRAGTYGRSVWELQPGAAPVAARRTARSRPTKKRKAPARQPRRR
jgi:photosystem II stability/assembly factor-like uncharacterized protein